MAKKKLSKRQALKKRLKKVFEHWDAGFPFAEVVAKLDKVKLSDVKQRQLTYQLRRHYDAVFETEQVTMDLLEELLLK